MKRLALMIAILATFSVAVTSTSSASVKVNASCGTTPAAKRPTNLYFYCGDNGMYATSLSWRSWGGKRAKSYGTVSYKACEPDCASGGVISGPGKVTLFRKVKCSRHRFQYSVLRAKAHNGPTRKIRLQTC